MTRTEAQIRVNKAYKEWVSFKPTSSYDDLIKLLLHEARRLVPKYIKGARQEDCEEVATDAVMYVLGQTNVRNCWALLQTSVRIECNKRVAPRRYKKDEYAHELLPLEAAINVGDNADEEIMTEILWQEVLAEIEKLPALQQEAIKHRLAEDKLTGTERKRVFDAIIKIRKELGICQNG